MKRSVLRIGSALQVLVGVATVFLVVAALSLMIGPRLVGWRPVVVLSGSMAPALPVGGLAFLKPVNTSQVKAGDIISFQHGNVRVTHRVAEITKDAQGALAFRTKGDANNDVDSGLVPAASVDGREVFAVPYLGRVAKILDSRLGFLGLVAIPALMIIAGEVVSLGKQFGEQRRKPTV